MSASRFFNQGATTGLADFLNSDSRKKLIAQLSANIHLLQKQLNRPLNILEIGCGTGMHANQFAQLGHHVFAVDPAEEMIAKGKEDFTHNNLTYVCDALPALEKLTNSHFDVIYSVGVWQYVKPEERQAAMDRMIELLAPGGLFSIIWPLPRSRDFQFPLTHSDINETVNAANTKRPDDQKILLSQGQPFRDPDNRMGFVETNEEVFFHTTTGSLPLTMLSNTLSPRP